MALGEQLCALDRGDRVRVLGWFDAAEVALDLVARVTAVERRRAGEASESGSVGVSLASAEGASTAIADALPEGLETTGGLELYALEAADGWRPPEVWLRDPESGDFETVGSVQHVQRV